MPGVLNAIAKLGGVRPLTLAQIQLGNDWQIHRGRALTGENDVAHNKLCFIEKPFA